MVIKEINICDVCNDRVSKSKCDICKKDVCSDCGFYSPKDVGWIRESLNVCNPCKNLKLSREFEKKMRKEVINHLKKQAILNKLKDVREEEHNGGITKVRKEMNKIKEKK